MKKKNSTPSSGSPLTNPPLVAILVGSPSDLPLIQPASLFLSRMNIPFELRILSAHRTPDELADFARSAHLAGFKLIIAAAGMAAHLAGVVAALSPLPVIAIPLNASPLQGLDALLSSIQMPPGVPVASVGINAALNAAILATRILALSDPALPPLLLDYKNELKHKVLSTPPSS